MDIFLVNQDNPHAQSLCEKLAKAKDGEFVPLTTPEFELHDSVDFQYINYGESSTTVLKEVIPGGNYIFVADEDTNIDDIIKAGNDLHIGIGIIRTGK
jgi:hypothetical protein